MTSTPRTESMNKHNLRDDTGKRFSRLLELRLMPDRDKYKRTLFECLCDCGKKTIVKGNNLRTGTTKSCGCLDRDVLIERNFKHGLSGTRTHNIWRGLFKRCYNPNEKAYKYYGKRGIKICKKWHDFKKFFSDMGECPDGMSIERINKDGDYKPSNCKWASDKEQANNKSNNTFLSYRGKKLTISQWSDELGINKYTISTRIGRGYSIEKALTKPVTTLTGR